MLTNAYVWFKALWHQIVEILLTKCTNFSLRENKNVFLVHLGAWEHAHTLEPQDHEAVADGDDEDGHDEGEDEDADLQQGVPVPGGVGEDQLAVDDGGGCAGWSLQVNRATNVHYSHSMFSLRAAFLWNVYSIRLYTMTMTHPEPSDFELMTENR